MSISKEKLPSISLSYKKNSNDSFSHQDEKKALERVKIFFEKGLIIISMGEKIPSILLDDIFDTAIDRLISAYSKSEESIDINVPKGVDAVRYMVAQKVTKILLGDSFSVESIVISKNIADIASPVEQELDLELSESDLQRIEDLKKEYSHFNKDYLNSLIISFQLIVDEIKAVDGLKLNPSEDIIKKSEILEKYGLKKWLGERKEGIRPIQFLEKYYKKWLDAGVLFKASLRILDKELVAVFRDRHSLYNENDPLITDTQRTEMLAAAIIGNTEQQKKAQRLLVVRPEQRKISALLRA